MINGKRLNTTIIFLLLINLLLGGGIFYLARLLSIKLPEVFVAVPYAPANIVIDAKNEGGLIQPFWLGFAQGGEEAKNMLSPTVGQMKQLNPSYIRLDHIFDDDYYGVVSGSSGNLQFNWSKLDEAVNDILAMGAKPFLSLGYMPSAIASSKIDKPHNWDDWFALVKATVEHYSGKGGKNINDIYYEVWNEPDLEHFGKWGRGGEKNYLTLYEYSVRGAMAAENANRFFIGGPATTALYRNWVLDLYNFCAKKSLRLDFISWHRYSFAPSRFSADIADLYGWLKGKTLPRLVISEWGPTPEKDNSYSTGYAAAHAVAVTRELLDLVNLMTAFEVKDGPGQGTSGWGLLSHETAGVRPKPRFHAFSWLAQVKGKRLPLSGEGSNVVGWATKEGKNLVVLVVNFGQGAKKETVPITIKSLNNGEYEERKEVLFGQKSQGKLIVKDGLLRTNLTLEPNQIARLTLKALQIFPEQAKPAVSPEAGLSSPLPITSPVGLPESLPFTVEVLPSPSVYSGPSALEESARRYQQKSEQSPSPEPASSAKLPDLPETEGLTFGQFVWQELPDFLQAIIPKPE